VDPAQIRSATRERLVGLRSLLTQSPSARHGRDYAGSHGFEMRILLTGISGQIGSALLARLSDHEVVAADRATLNLAKPDELPSRLDALAPEVIINPAAYTAVDKAEDEPELAYLVNAAAPAKMARWAAVNKVPLLHFSTDYVFDGTGRHPWQEDDRASPLSVYGETKLAGENAIRAEGDAFMILRTSWVYAVQGKNFLRTISRLAIERRELRVIADQVGAPTSARVVADIVQRIVSGDLDAFRSRCAQAHGLVHVCGAGETTWHGFATAIVEGLRARGVSLAVERIQPISSDEYASRAKRPHNSRLDLSRLVRLFGIMPPRWRESLGKELDIVAETLR
jgi:dTDP-4-dehydrorhamnose reductase